MSSNTTSLSTTISSTTPSTPGTTISSPPTSTPSTTPSSSQTVPSTSTATPPSSSSVPPSSSEPPTSSSSSVPPPSTSVPTSAPPPPATRTTTIVNVTSGGGTTTIVQTVAAPATSSAPPPTSSTATTSAPPTLSGNAGSGGSGSSEGLGTGGKVAIAVVIPVVAVALLILLGIFLWRKRKAKKAAEEERRNEIHDYGYNPNNDPTIPNVGGTGSAMAEDSSGYRGWGVTPTVAGAGSTQRKTSTTLSNGMTSGAFSDNGRDANYLGGPGSPDAHASDGHSLDPLVHGPADGNMSTDEVAALGIAPSAAANPQIKRGPSNASSAYSNGARSDNSDGDPPVPGAAGQYDYNQQYGYSQHGPYGDGSYGGAQDTGMPVVRDVSARRNTRIEEGGTYQQGNSGIAQNF